MTIDRRSPCWNSPWKAESKLLPRARSSERLARVIWEDAGMIPRRAARFRWSSARRRAVTSKSAARKSAGFVRLSKYPSAPACSAMKTSSLSSTAVSITICVFGSNAFRRAVHSMPDMRGKKISISTASGWTAGISRNASSPEEQTHSHEKSENELMSFDQLSRKSALSSTSAIFNRGIAEIRTVSRFIIDCLRWFLFQRERPAADAPFRQAAPARVKTNSASADAAAHAFSGNIKFNPAAEARRAVNREFSADLFHALRHVRQPVAS